MFVYANDKVERRPVTLGPEPGATRRVLKGLRDGERVVLSPPDTAEGRRRREGGGERLTPSGRRRA